MYETQTETGGPCLVRKLGWGSMASLPPSPPFPSGWAPVT